MVNQKVKLTTSDVYAIVPAAGYGSRMQHIEYPKQYLSIGNKTVLEHTITALLAHPRILRIIIVINPEDKKINKLTSLLNHPQIIIINGGGTKRADSVLAGVNAAENVAWVLIHDAVRPCLHKSDLIKLLSISESNYVGGVLAIPAYDTMKRSRSDDTIAHTVDRTNLWHALTPQFFPRKLLYNCLIRALNEGANITDESSALEYCGFHPILIRGRTDNIKVTCLEDLQFAEYFLIHTTTQQNIM